MKRLWKQRVGNKNTFGNIKHSIFLAILVRNILFCLTLLKRFSLLEPLWLKIYYCGEINKTKIEFLFVFMWVTVNPSKVFNFESKFLTNIQVGF